MLKQGTLEEEFAYGTVYCVKVGERKRGQTVTVKRGGSGTDEPHRFGWRDAMDIVVKWRQLSEPNDQVWPQPGCLALVSLICGAGRLGRRPGLGGLHLPDTKVLASSYVAMSV